MKPLVALLLPALGLLAACDSPATTARATPPVAPQPAPAHEAAAEPAAGGAAEPAAGGAAEPAEELAADSTGEYETMYVVIADTSRQYRPLRRQLLRLQAATGQRIDTLGRFYDPHKDLIRLPDDADEMYAGDYFPRRLADATLSVEYTDLYTPARAKTMALVTGIYAERGRADSLLAVVRRTAPTAFRVRTRMYMGCLH